MSLTDLRANCGAYEFLREHDLGAVSSTSRLLRAGDLAFLMGRAQAEIEELRGTIAGTHGHGGGQEDIVLEASQSIYWLLLVAVAAGDRLDDLGLRHDLFLPGADAGGSMPELILPAPDVLDNPAERRALVRRALELVVALCRQAGVEPLRAIRRDTMELRTRPYLAPYWSTWDHGEKATGEGTIP